jgi:hypothetical protein
MIMAKRIIGNAEEAKKWIMESSLQEENKTKLLHFVSKFSTLAFFKKEQRESAPEWLKELGRIILGLDSDNLLWYRFKYFEHDEYEDYQFLDSFYNYQGFAEDIGEYTEIFLEGEPLLIIAAELDSLRSILAVKGGDSEDMKVYDFSYEDIENAGSGKGEVNSSDVKVAFSNYYEMLNQVGAVMFSEEHIVEADE